MLWGKGKKNDKDDSVAISSIAQSDPYNQVTGAKKHTKSVKKKRYILLIVALVIVCAAAVSTYLIWIGNQKIQKKDPGKVSVICANDKGLLNKAKQALDSKNIETSRDIALGIMNLEDYSDDINCLYIINVYYDLLGISDSKLVSLFIQKMDGGVKVSDVFGLTENDLKDSVSRWQSTLKRINSQNSIVSDGYSCSGSICSKTEKSGLDLNKIDMEMK